MLCPLSKGDNKLYGENTEPPDKFQPNLAEIILGLRGLSFFQMKDPV